MMNKILIICAFMYFNTTILAKDLEWTIPQKWELSSEKKAMRLATFLVKSDKSLAISVSRFPGDVGGELANVNRWRRQIGLPPVAAENLQKSFDVIKNDAGTAKLLDISNGDEQMLAVMLPYKGSTYFFKLVGQKDKVSKQKESMVELVKSFK